ncbi:MAG: hypothetical protein OXQ28_04155 [Acidobacteriota bacterium]|nr:hypothetical protein [Acidobacteriota bacterium]
MRYVSLAVLLATTGLLVWFVAGERDSGAATEAVPGYTVASRADVPDLGVVGEVLVPGAARTDPNREDLFRAIAQVEGLTVAFYFSTADAVEAHRATARDAAQLDALRAGFLGRLTRDEFTPGEELYP